MITGIDPQTLDEPGDPRIPALIERIAVARYRRNQARQAELAAQKELTDLLQGLYVNRVIGEGWIHAAVNVVDNGRVPWIMIDSDLSPYLPEPSTPAAW